MTLVAYRVKERKTKGWPRWEVNIKVRMREPLHSRFKMFLESLYFYKYTTVQSYNIYFLVQLYSSASYCKDVGNITGRSHFVKAFSALPSHS